MQELKLSVKVRCQSLILELVLRMKTLYTLVGLTASEVLALKILELAATLRYLKRLELVQSTIKYWSMVPN